jgi:hypothetical protein
MSSHDLQCMEVWGGNQSANSAVSMSGLDAWIYSKPYRGDARGGDVYYVSSCATGRIARMLVADVAGHGQAVADVATQLRGLMRRHVNQIDQSRFVQSMNQQFAALCGDGCFATALVTTFFAPTNHLSLCNAGHPPPLLYRATTRQWSFLDQRCAGGDEFANVPLGVMDLVNYDQFDVKLQVGDLVLAYTDSVTESLDQNGDMLGLGGLLELARSLDVRNPPRLIPQLMSALRQRCGHDVADDDLTILLLRPNGSGARVPMRDRALAPMRLMKNLLASVTRGEPMAWPEWSLANVGGALFGPLNRLWSRHRAPHVLATRVHAVLPDPMTVHIADPRDPRDPRVRQRSALVQAVVAAVESRVAAAAVAAESANVAPVEINSAA